MISHYHSAIATLSRTHPSIQITTSELDRLGSMPWIDLYRLPKHLIILLLFLSTSAGRI